MSLIKNENYINISGWMVNDLGLKGNELLVYAIIYGFSQDGKNRYTGSLQYLADWTNSSKQGIQKNLKTLIEKGLIGKEDIYYNNVKFCEYYATQLHGVYNSVVQGIQLSCTNNIEDNIENNIDIKKETKKERKNAFETIIEDIENEGLKEAIYAFIDMRKTIKKPMTERALKMLINKLNKMTNDDNVKIAILDQSIMHNWQDIYELKENNKSTYRNNIVVDMPAYMNEKHQEKEASNEIKERIRSMQNAMKF